mgnify:CR=1 FL=1|jgi:predicted transcriptional regulator
MDNCILLSIRKDWAAAILSSKKKMEIRKRVPSYNPNTEKRAEYPLRVVMYETKAHGGAWLYGWKVQNPRRLPEPVPLEAIHMDRAPQSWCWLNSINAADLAEIAAAQGVKL